jgi:hypothetical protein
MNPLRLLANLAIFLVPAALAAWSSARLVRTSYREWKLMVWLPVLPLAAWGAMIAWSVTRDPTAHNLWPLELVFWAAVSAALQAIVLVVRRLARGRLIDHPEPTPHFGDG